jgi:ComF family protein
MTTLLEKLTTVVAPHRCILCSEDNNVLCDNCLLQLPARHDLCCFACDAPAPTTAVCAGCKKQSGILQAWVPGEYEGALAKAIKLVKFERARAATEPLAKFIDANLPQLPEGTLIVPVVTAPARLRQRGYDQAVLIAKELARRKNRPMEQLLGRQAAIRQVGASREQRIRQAHDAFYLRKPQKVAGATVLLVDDVVTTGATLKAAATLLSQAGAAAVYVTAVAKQGMK